MSRNAAFFLLASITVTFLAGSSAPTPIYPLYQAQWGFSAVMVTVVFGVYALAVLAALLVTGRLSDHVGRRPVLLAATAAQAATMALYVVADGLGTLIAARILQGLATGAAVAAVGAGLLDLDKSRGTVANAVTTPIGTALGAIAAGALVQYLPQPTHLVFELLAAIYVVQWIGVFLMPETATTRAGAWRSLRPQLGLPRASRDPMLLAAPALVATWALAGFYASLGPAVVRGMLGTNSALAGGLSLFVLAASGAVSVLLLQGREPRGLMRLGTAVLVAGVAVSLTGLASHSIAAFFAGTALSGFGFGAGFQGAVRGVVASAAAHERAGVLSVAFVVAYLAMGLPAVIAGWFLTHQGSLLVVSRDFGMGVMALATLAFYGTLRSSRASSSTSAALASEIARNSRPPCVQRTTL